MDSRRFCFACDLKDEPQLIKEYQAYHAQGKTWPEINDSIKAAGILNMEIYLYENRLFMIMEVDESYSPEKKQQMDALNPKVQEWEKLMWKYQQSLPKAKEGEKWMLMKQIFSLNQK